VAPTWIFIVTALTGAITAIASPIVAVVALRTSTRMQKQQLEITKAQNRVSLQWELCADLYQRLDKASTYIYDAHLGMADEHWKTWWYEGEHAGIYADIKHLGVIAGQGVIVKAHKALHELTKVVEGEPADPDVPEPVWGQFNEALEELRFAIRSDLWDGWPEQDSRQSRWRSRLRGSSDQDGQKSRPSKSLSDGRSNGTQRT